MQTLKLISKPYWIRVIRERSDIEEHLNGPPIIAFKVWVNLGPLIVITDGSYFYFENKPKMFYELLLKTHGKFRHDWYPIHKNQGKFKVE